MKAHALTITLATAALALSACTQEQPAPTPPPQDTPAPAVEGTEAMPDTEGRPTPAPTPETTEEIPPTAAPPVDPVAPPQTQPPQTTPPGAAAPQQGETVIETIETDSGLIIEVLREGTGETVRPGDTIVVHYHGTLGDGRVFDSSYNRGEPTRLGLQGVIRGWQEGIPGMKVGGKRRLIIPPELGYGARGSGANIPPNSMLIFDIEVFDIIR